MVLFFLCLMLSFTPYVYSDELMSEAVCFEGSQNVLQLKIDSDLNQQKDGLSKDKDVEDKLKIIGRASVICLTAGAGISILIYNLLKNSDTNISKSNLVPDKMLSSDLDAAKMIKKYYKPHRKKDSFDPKGECGILQSGYYSRFKLDVRQVPTGICWIVYVARQYCQDCVPASLAYLCQRNENLPDTQTIQYRYEKYSQWGVKDIFIPEEYRSNFDGRYDAICYQNSIFILGINYFSFGVPVGEHRRPRAILNAEILVGEINKFKYELDKLKRVLVWYKDLRKIGNVEDRQLMGHFIAIEVQKKADDSFIIICYDTASNALNWCQKGAKFLYNILTLSEEELINRYNTWLNGSDLWILPFLD